MKRLKFPAIAFASLAFLWLTWLWISQHRLQSVLDDLRSRHLPVSAADLDLSPIPSKQNAAFYYQAADAAQSTTVCSPANSDKTFSNYPPYPAAWQTMEDQAIAANQQALALAHQASAFPRADWGLTTQPVLSFPFSVRFNYNLERGLSGLISDAALQAHSHGNDALALQRVFDLLHLGDATQQRGFLISRLVAFGILGQAISDIDVLAVDLQMAPNRQAILQLIHQLLDDQRNLDAREAMATDEMILSIEQLRSLASQATILRPMIYLSEARIATHVAQFCLSMAQTDYPDSVAVWPYSTPNYILSYRPPPHPQAPRFSRLAEYLCGDYYPDLQPLIEYRQIAGYRCAAISLAMNLYHTDHHSWPHNLSALVPQYLPAVPNDPFFKTPQPIGYTIINGTRPMLFYDENDQPSPISPTSQPTFAYNSGRDSRHWLDVTNWWQSPHSQ